jgi:hypothetical protein
MCNNECFCIAESMEKVELNQDTGVRRGEGRQRSRAVGFHPNFPTTVGSGKTCTMFKVQGENGLTE